MRSIIRDKIDDSRFKRLSLIRLRRLRYFKTKGIISIGEPQKWDSALNLPKPRELKGLAARQPQ